MRVAVTWPLNQQHVWPVFCCHTTMSQQHQTHAGLHSPQRKVSLRGRGTLFRGEVSYGGNVQWGLWQVVRGTAPRRNQLLRCTPCRHSGEYAAEKPIDMPNSVLVCPLVLCVVVDGGARTAAHQTHTPNRHEGREHHHGPTLSDLWPVHSSQSLLLITAVPQMFVPCSAAETGLVNNSSE